MVIPENRKKVADAGGIEAVVNAISNNTDNANVCNIGCLTLFGMIFDKGIHNSTCFYNQD